MDENINKAWFNYLFTICMYHFNLNFFISVLNFHFIFFSFLKTTDFIIIENNVHDWLIIKKENFKVCWFVFFFLIQISIPCQQGEAKSKQPKYRFNIFKYQTLCFILKQFFYIQDKIINKQNTFLIIFFRKNTN